MNDATEEASEVNEYDVAQALGHPLPAPRSSTVWVAVATDPFGEWLQTAGASKDAALNALRDTIIETWLEFTSFPFHKNHGLFHEKSAEEVKEAVAKYLAEHTREEIFEEYTETQEGNSYWRVEEVVIR